MSLVPVGWNPVEISAGDGGQGSTARTIDPTTGAGIFNPNTNPQVVGIDPQTGVAAPLGTDQSFGSAIRRQIQTGVINGDFAQLPPLGVNSFISDAADHGSAGYNGLPGWDWHPASDGSQTLQVASSGYDPHRYRLILTSSVATGGGYLEQWVPVPMSVGQQYRIVASLYAESGTPALISLSTTFYQFDATTPANLSPGAVTTTLTASGELKVDLGLVPTDGGYVRLRVLFNAQVATGYVYEIRAPAVPTEVALGLETSITGVGPVTNTETTVISHLVPANSLVAGATYRIRVASTVTDATTAKAITHRIRVGPALLAGAVATSIAPVTTGTASTDPSIFEAELVIRSVGAGGTGWASCKQTGNAAQPFSNPTTVDVATGTFAVDTTVANYIEMTLQTANAATSITARQATLECVRS